MNAKAKRKTAPEDIIIAVMGMTGAGKSKFIKTVTGRTDIVVGDRLDSGKQVNQKDDLRASLD